MRRARGGGWREEEEEEEDQVQEERLGVSAFLNEDETNMFHDLFS